jgi:hypothetical protein
VVKLLPLALLHLGINRRAVVNPNRLGFSTTQPAAWTVKSNGMASGQRPIGRSRVKRIHGCILKDVMLALMLESLRVWFKTRPRVCHDLDAASQFNFWERNVINPEPEIRRLMDVMPASGRMAAKIAR